MSRTSSQALMEWKDKHPNLAHRPGWDERDYELWSAIKQLPSYGLRGVTVLVSAADVVELLEQHARQRLCRAARTEEGL